MKKPFWKFHDITKIFNQNRVLRPPALATKFHNLITKSFAFDRMRQENGFNFIKYIYIFILQHFFFLTRIITSLIVVAWLITNFDGRFKEISVDWSTWSSQTCRNNNKPLADSIYNKTARFYVRTLKCKKEPLNVLNV